MRRRTCLALGLAAATLAVIACATGSGPQPRAGVSAAEGWAAFETVRAVLQHPRCANCHPAGDTPLQYDDGRPHGQLVMRGEGGKGVPGMRCAACHFEANPPKAYGVRAAPGAPHWQMPPAAMPMVFAGRSSAELARSLADPKANGGKGLAALVEHVSKDPLVLWGWSPGGDRAPVPVPHAEFVAAFRKWVDAGAPAAP